MTIAEMDNGMLRLTAMDYVGRARKFQEEINEASLLAGIKRQRDLIEHQAEPEAERSQRARVHNDAIAARYTADKNRWLSEFRADGVLLYEELMKRTGAPRIAIVALDYGMLSGVNPIEEVAHHIEKLAKTLSGGMDAGSLTLQ